MKEAERYFNVSKNLLMQAEEELSKKNIDTALVENYATKVFPSPRASKYIYISFDLLFEPLRLIQWTSTSDNKRTLKKMIKDRTLKLDLSQRSKR